MKYYKKNIIKNNFNKACQSYDQIALLQKQCAKIMVEHLREQTNNNFNKILDLGAGTGFVTEQLLKYFPNSSYVLSDISSLMLKVAQSKFTAYKNISYIKADMENQEFDFYPLIISNMAFQWVTNPNNLITKLLDKTNVLTFSCLTKDTFIEWSNIYKSLNLTPPTFNYPTIQQLEKDCLSHKVKSHFFATKDFCLNFTSAIEFAKYLKSIGANTSSNSNQGLNLRKVIKYYDKPLSVSYRVFFALLIRNVK
jgi:malonyl-CoA O-methyltransferase